MKRRSSFAIKLVLLIVTMLSISSEISAYDAEINGVCYNLNLTDLTASVTKGDNNYSGNVVIPSAISIKSRIIRVDSIEPGCFQNCDNLKSVTINEGVTKIGKWVFENCQSLVFVSLPKDLHAIPYGAFRGCTILSNIDLPKAIQKIDDYAFFGCKNLTHIQFPNNIKLIGSKAFTECGLQDVTLSDSLRSLGEDAFQNCLSLSSIDFGNGLSEIPVHCFENCPISTIEIPSNVTTLHYSAFNGCTKVKSIRFSNEEIDLKGFHDNPHPRSFISHFTTKMCPSSIFFDGSIKVPGIESYDDFDRMYYDIADPWSPDSIYEVSFGETFKGFDTSRGGTSFSTHPYVYYDSGCLQVVNSHIYDTTQFRPHFSNRTYMNATLYVPVGMKPLYEITDGWKEFFDIQEKDFSTGIVNPQVAKAHKAIRWYNASGIEMDKPQKGMNIIKYSDGHIEKVLIK